MKTNIIKIGNSKGIIIPSSILNQLKLSQNSPVELSVAKGNIIIKRAPRQGWEEAAKQMHDNMDDQLLIPPTLTCFDKEEWTW